MRAAIHFPSMFCKSSLCIERHENFFHTLPMHELNSQTLMKNYGLCKRAVIHFLVIYNVCFFLSHNMYKKKINIVYPIHVLARCMMKQTVLEIFIPCQCMNWIHKLHVAKAFRQSSHINFFFKTWWHWRRITGFASERPSIFSLMSSFFVS